MSDYNTPRRKHSSLFQRMEDEINKISKKLSAAKQIRQTHTHSRKATISHPIPSFVSSPFDTPRQTVRRNKNLDIDSKQLTKKMGYLQDRTNMMEPRNSGPTKKLRFGSQLQEPQSRQFKRLLDENRVLEQQMKAMNAVCQEQAFKIGYLRAQNRQTTAQYQSQRAQLRQQRVYLSKLAEGYKLKVQKYKRWVGNEQSLQLQIQDL